MQVHGPSRTLKEDGSEVHSHLNGDFVDMKIGDVHLYIRTPEECDWIIRAAASGKSALLEHRAKTAPAWCPAFTEFEDEGVTAYCDRKAGHPGSHHAPGPDEGSEVAWSDEPEPVSPEVAEQPKVCSSGLQHLGNGVALKCELDAGHDGAHSRMPVRPVFEVVHADAAATE